MDIDKLDFTPFYRYRRIEDKTLILSLDEHNFLEVIFGKDTWIGEGTPSIAYLSQLTTYYQRFNTHMPIPIRKQLLRDMVSGART